MIIEARPRYRKSIDHESKLKEFLKLTNTALDNKEVIKAENYLTEFEDLYQTTGYKKSVDRLYDSTKIRYIRSLTTR